MNKIDEKIMEDLIAEYPERFLGESGLILIERQLKVGPYRFDLMFQDRTGAKLIVEIQKGTLDREHTYKILDYYDEFKERNPKEFVEIMLVANIIPAERKQRLASRGISYREIPLSEFIDNFVDTSKSLPANLLSENFITPVSSVENKPNKSPYIMTDFALFLDQKDRFIKALSGYDTKVWYPPLRGKYEEDVPGNWFTCFVPEAWGHWKANYGVHFDLIYARAKNKLPVRFRLAIGVESPLKEQYRQAFKEEVISRIIAKKINYSGFSLTAMNRKKLLEADPIPFGTESWRIVLDKYIVLHPIVAIIGEVSKEYSEQGAFDSPIQFQ
jgi:hypothetical protein